MRKPLPSILCLSLACAITAAHADAEFPGAPEFSCLFTDLRTCGFAEQSRGAGRVSLVRIAGMDGVRLHTRPGDSHVHGSRAAERSDLQLSQQASDCFEGREHWWAHSVLFPDDYVAPPESTATHWHFGVVADFHNTAPGAGQANFQVNAMPASAISPDRPTGLVFQIAYGEQRRPSLYHAPIGPVVKNAWYHFVYHVQWSSAADGYFDAWVNGMQKMAYRGPTLYPGQGCYFKLANYHSAFGRPSSVIHARVVRGSTPGAVSAGPLEGILHLRQASRNGR
jgi:hypothetical protein